MTALEPLFFGVKWCDEQWREVVESKNRPPHDKSVEVLDTSQVCIARWWWSSLRFHWEIAMQRWMSG